jgi:hypothetical protein
MITSSISVPLEMTPGIGMESSRVPEKGIPPRIQSESITELMRRGGLSEEDVVNHERWELFSGSP